MNRGPVFVAGLERSGTSLMFALLASHPNIAMTRRTNLWTYFYDQYGDLSDPVNFESCLDMMMQYKRLVVLRPDAERIRQEFRAGEPSYGRLFALLEEHHAERAGKPRWGDKSLHTERYTKPILSAYPGARILHMIRDPRDRYASVITRWKVRRGGVGAGTAEWLQSSRLAERNRRRYPDQYLIVRYEELAAEPERTLRAICDFIDEEYAPEMLSMRGAATFRDQGSNSSYQAREPGAISTDSIGRFREVLPASQIAFVQAFTGRHMAMFGYKPERLDFSRSGRARLFLADLPLETGRMVAWWIRESMRNRIGRPLPAYRLVPREAAHDLGG